MGNNVYLSGADWWGEGVSGSLSLTKMSALLLHHIPFHNPSSHPLKNPGFAPAIASYYSLEEYQCCVLWLLHLKTTKITQAITFGQL